MNEIATISYPFQVGGQIPDRGLWMAEVAGEVYDYGSVAALKAGLETDGYAWRVVRRHRDGSTTILESSSAD